jgi:hypothetical protein
MRLQVILPMLYGLLLLNGYGKRAELQVEPRQVCEVIDHIDEFKGQRLVVQGIYHRPDRALPMLTDCRGFPCQSGKIGLVIDREPKATRSRPGSVDDSFDRLLAAVKKQPVPEMIVTFEGTIRVADNPFTYDHAPFIVLDVSNVKSMKPVRFDRKKRLNNCE